MQMPQEKKTGSKNGSMESKDLLLKYNQKKNIKRPVKAYYDLKTHFVVRRDISHQKIFTTNKYLIHDSIKSRKP